MEIVLYAGLILLFVLILCYPQECKDSYNSSLVLNDIPPEHDMVADRCKSYYLNPKNVQECINSNCRRLCSERGDCFDSCSLWNLIH